MRGPRTTGFAATGLAVLALAGAGQATTIQTEGAGSAVISIDRPANFDPLTSNNTVNLDACQEGGLPVTTASTSWGEDPALALDGLKVQLQPMPEPSALLLVGLGAGLLGVARRSRPR